ncbi:hypothetical protein E2C01_069136 [Portunus trituberculatus]|uniref:Uncharacterized protein n=1 Tax=Portunus trituberculatus TaxID=210409 RepID=A0A5B7HPA5_PORTR|nr:hypothetical protein [Portunus trituberculatus]
MQNTKRVRILQLYKESEKRKDQGNSTLPTIPKRHQNLYNLQASAPGISPFLFLAPPRAWPPHPHHRIS